MGLRCSLLGHDYGFPEVERDREERGTEVIITVREVERCKRCEATSVISENKEVKAIDRSSQRSEGDRAVDPEPETGAHADSTSAANEDAEMTAETDDAIILDDTDDSGGSDEGDEPIDRTYGQWPDREEEPPSEDAPPVEDSFEWPAVEDDDEGFDAEHATDDGAVELGNGLEPNPDSVDPVDEDAEFIESVDSSPQLNVDDVSPPPQNSDSKPETGFTSAAPAPGPGVSPQKDEVTEFICPECSLVRDSETSSLRAGDICPECRRGYLAERDV